MNISPRLVSLGILTIIAILILGIAVVSRSFFSQKEEHWISLAERGDPAAIPRAMEDLKYGDPNIRCFTIAFLLAMGPKAEPATPVLITMLDDPEPRARSMSAYALGSIGADAEDAVPKLVAMLADRDPSIRAASASALGGIGPGAQEARPALIEALEDQEKEVRDASSNALEAMSLYDLTLDEDAKKRQKEQIESLMEGLKSDTSVERYRSATILGQIGPEAQRAVPNLLKLLADERRFVRRAAAEALMKIDPERYRDKSQSRKGQEMVSGTFTYP